MLCQSFLIEHRMFTKFLSIYLEIEDEHDRLLKKNSLVREMPKNM